MGSQDCRLALPGNFRGRELLSGTAGSRSSRTEEYQSLHCADFRETGIPLVVTNDCHYISPEDSEMHKVLLCIQTNHTLQDKDGMEFGSDQFYFKTEEEMRLLFPSLPGLRTAQ